MNNIRMNKVFIFAVGFVSGYVTTYLVMRKKESERIYFTEDDSDTTKHNIAETGEAEKQFSEEYDNLLNKEGYVNNEETEKEDDNLTKPYVIAPDEFGDDYETETLTYYADGILEDEFGEVIEDDEIEEMIGKDSLNHFGEYEQDTVYVRNDNRQTDYEILRDLSSYSEVMRNYDPR